MAWLLDRLRKKVEAGDDQPSHFDDLKYIVGNTSGLDIGNVPSPLDQRIGQMSQIGGSIMEIEIDNPATFQIDRPEIKNVIDQLGYDKVTLHGDKNLGFTAAYATRGQGVVGYNVVHRYFTTYLEQMASFRKEVNEIEGRFDLGYVNMHASNEQIPPREERLASDVSVDPFGNSITTINGEKEKNIYRNEKFREKMFDFFFLEVVEQPWRQYEQTFSDSDEDFRETWNKWKAKKADKLFFSNGIDTSERISLFETAASIDQGAEKEFLQNLDNYDLEEPIKIHISLETEDDETIEETEEIRNLEAISNIFRRETGRVFSNTARLSRDLFDLKNKNAVPEGIEPRVEGWDIPEKALDEKMDELVRDLWGRGNESSLSAQGKLQSLSRNLDIQNSQIFEEAQEENEVIEKARQAFAKPDNDKILKNLTQGRIRDDFNKESSLFFHIIPAWMQFADEEDENHQGWDAPKFIWDAIVESNNEKDRNLSNYNEYKDFLDESRENELNVIAAVAACYIWGHFTQKKDRFSNDAFRSPPDIPDEEVPELKGGEEGDYTWLEWMNMFNLKVNFEAMFGSPGQLTRLWRPKDIAVLCHAINQTGKEMLDDYNESLVKFTIDMEHTASYGVDPLQEIEYLIQQEKELAASGKIDVDPDKPLADIIRTYHLTKPGWEQQQGHRHGPFTRGDRTLYRWLYRMVDNGFCRGDEEAIIIFEVGGEYREEIYMIKLAMDMIEMGIEPEEVKVENVPSDGNYENVKQELIARFFGLEDSSVDREWAKIEEHAFDPLKGLLEAEEFDYTHSSRAATENENRPGTWKQEEYR